MESNPGILSDSLGNSPLTEMVSAILISKVTPEEWFYSKFFHFVRQEPNYDFSLQIIVFGFIAAIE